MSYAENLQYYDYVRTALTGTIDNLYNLEGQDECRTFISEFRAIPLSYIESAKLVYILDKQVIHENVDSTSLDILGFTYNDDNIFRERFIIPVKDQDGRVAGMVGYDSESDTKYLFSRTQFFDKTKMFYNMENIDRIYRAGYVILVEGFFDSIRLSSIGLEENWSAMGSILYPYQKTIVNRIPLKIIMPDSDDTGKQAGLYWKNVKGKVAYIKLKPRDDKKLKDIDAIIKNEPTESERFRKLVDKIKLESQSPFFTYREYYF